MIENKIQLLPISGIILGREERFRKKLNGEHVRRLARQIQDHGLIHAVLVNAETGQLIAGENRIAAFEYLQTIEAECKFSSYQGWTKIPTRKAKDVTQLERGIMELSENIGNSPMLWQDIAAGIVALQDQMEGEEDSSAAALSQHLGLSKSQIWRYLILGRNLHLEEIVACTSSKTAINILNRKKERALDSIMDNADFDPEPAPIQSNGLGTEEENLQLEFPNEQPEKKRDSVPSQPKKAATPTIATETEKFVGTCEDFLSWAEHYSGPRFNLVHFDPPYGIGLDKSSTMKKSGRGQYEDSEDLFHAITDKLLQKQDRIISQSAHIVFWHSAQDRQMVVDKLTNAGWRVWLYPLIWHKSCNTGLFPDSNRGPRHTYEMATLASRGDRKIVKLVADSFSSPAVKSSGHESEKPVEMLEHFFTMLVDESTQIFDPTGGSGNSLRAAKRKGAAGGLFLELESHYPNAFNAEMRKGVTDA